MTAIKVQNMHISNCANESAQLHEDQLRVTSIPYTSSKMVIFSGTPLKKKSYRANSGKYYVTIKTYPNTLPVQPTIGQYWSVKGNRKVGSVNIGDYVMQQHTYESPEHVECTLPETGEQLIRFIAKESAFKGIGESKVRALWELLGKNFHATLRKDTPETRAKLRSVLSEDSIIALFEGYAK
jgi:exodeoxyribonuclease V alpha subunit